MNSRTLVVLLLASGLSSALAGDRANPQQSVLLDPQVGSSFDFLIGSFSVPTAARAEFEAALHENNTFLETLPGFKGHSAFEKISGPTTYNVVIITTWESAAAMKNAAPKVHEHDRNRGFDMQAAMARWGVTASVGNYQLSPSLQ